MDYRELFWILAKRDIMVRYKQTIFGVLWSVIKPLVSAFAYVFAFGFVGNLAQQTDIPYILIVLPGTILWLFFSQSLQTISLSIVVNNNLVSKVFFPRIIIPFSSFFLGMIELAISLVIFLFFCIYYDFFPDYKIIFAPIFILLAYIAASGIGLFAAVLNVRYRDIGQLIPFILQFGMFISPVAYTSGIVESGKPHLYKFFVLNPVTGCIDGLRWALLGDNAPFRWESFTPLLIFSFISIILSIRFFRKHENSFVDYI
ncbi:ABC transporter permease [Marinilongibacter aquaticus]|uniref:ABC transporter permease n=1 Tax=Marinilongibacter aquaticus TaxID=2975157 RepID=UPI0021BDE645|nr:ABC transporter permease [Marinilongibacter aquaticus]UBM59306.1 ABC transporter permease [Marinilongibacter aquaticus]